MSVQISHNLTQNSTSKYVSSDRTPSEQASRNDTLNEFLDSYSIEDVVGLKLGRFLEQLGSFEPENFHEMIMSRVEKPLIAQILQRVGGNQVHAARILGINRNTLRKKMKIYSLL